MIYVLAWVIGICNPLSALLVGPWLARRVSWARKAQGFGWALLALAQVAFLAFGFASQLDGFRYAQPLMIPLAALNFWAWFQAIPNRRVRRAEAEHERDMLRQEGAASIRLAVAMVLARMDHQQQVTDERGGRELAWYYYREEVEQALGLPRDSLDSGEPSPDCDCKICTDWLVAAIDGPPEEG